MSYHTIGATAKRTGLSTHLIRSWETRYHAIVPSRTASNRRVYSDDDIERLKLLHKAKLGGRSISYVAAVDTPELRRIVEQDERLAREAQGAGRHDRVATEPEELLGACHAAVRDLDSAALASHIQAASQSLPLNEALENVIVPLMHELGSAWREGTLRPVHEHLATAVVKSFLGSLPQAGPDRSLPELIVGTPAGQIHELGALMAAAIAAASGWRATYVGANLRADTLAAAVRKRDAEAIALSIVFPVDDVNLGVELDELLFLLPPAFPILVGGQGAPYYQTALDRIGAMRVSSYGSLSSVLARVQRERERAGEPDGGIELAG